MAKNVGFNTVVVYAKGISNNRLQFFVLWSIKNRSQ